jgi:hypothetical protein
MKIIRTVALTGGAFVVGAYSMAKFFKANLSPETRLEVAEEIKWHVDERRAILEEEREAAKSRHPAGKGIDLPFSTPYGTTPILKGN